MSTTLQLRVLIPSILTIGFIADVGARFISPTAIAFRAWEAATAFPAAGGPFAANLVYNNDRTHGDLSNLGNLPAMQVYRSETFTTDAFGYRITPFEENRPVRILVVGDSFTGGAGLKDTETLTAQLAEITGEGVYNCGERLDWPSIERLIQRLHLNGGTVVWQISEREPPEAPLQAPNIEARLFRRLAPAGLRERWKAIPDRALQVRKELTNYVSYSPAKIVITRLFKVAENGSWLPNPYARNVVVARVRDGKAMVFLKSEVENFGKIRPASREFFIQLRALVEATGNQLLVVAVPDKYNVYYPLLEGSGTPPAEEDTTLGRISADLRAEGVAALDLTPEFREQAAVALKGGRYIYTIDDTHWNSAGVAIAAREMAEFLPK